MSAIISAINGSFAVGCQMADGSPPSNARFADSILVQYSLANLLDSVNQSGVKLTFPDGILFDLWIQNGDGHVVWRYTQPAPGAQLESCVAFASTFNIPIEPGDPLSGNKAAEAQIPSIDLRTVITDPKNPIPPETELSVFFRPLHAEFAHEYQCLLWRGTGESC